MTPIARSLPALLLLITTGLAPAAPDEEALGKAAGYPAATQRSDAFREPYLVGSFSGMDGFLPSCTLAPAAEPLALKKAAAEPAFRYRFAGRSLTLDDYMQRQRVTGLLVLKDGEIVAERYNYDRTAQMRMLSNSMAKTITALAVMKALEAGAIRSLDDTADTYVPALAGTLYGQTRLVHLMRMASGARYVENYTPDDDRAAFLALARRQGTLAALKSIQDRADPPGERFNYAGPQTEVLGQVVRAATGRTLCDFVAETLWQPLGAESKATWLTNPIDQQPQAQGGFNATVRDYARLGWMMARDGQGLAGPVLSRESLLAMTDANRQPEAFRPGRMEQHGSTYFGYGFQTWLLPGSHRRFVLMGIHGQAILVDPELQLVVVHTAVGKDASGNASGHRLGAERDALFRGIVARYGNW